MKKLISLHRLLSSMAALALLALATPKASAALSAEVFYDALDPYGDWIKTEDYGYAFHPRDVGEDWRPYTDGNWAYTDAGWTFVSEEPHAWATYHYGRWANLETTGWVWVPDTEWAPAWVSWRRSNDYIGWSPLPPEARFERKVGFHAWVDSNYDIGPTNYSFVRVRDLGAPRLRTVIVQPRENITIIRETRNITNVTYVNNVVINNGPEYDVVVRESAQPIRRLRLERQQEFNDAGAFRDGRARTTVQGDSLRIVAPSFTAINTSVAPKKVARTVSSVQVNRGWRDAGSPEQVQQVRTTIAAEQKAPPSVVAATKLRGVNRSPSATAEPAAATSKTTETAPPATAPAARTAEMPPANRPGKPGRPNRPEATDPAAPTAATAPADAPEAPSPKPGERPKRRPGQTAEKRNEGPSPTAATTTPDSRPPGEESPTRKPQQVAPGEPLPPGAPAGPAPRAKRGAPENAPASETAPERRMPKGKASVEDAPAPGEAPAERAPKGKGPKNSRPEGLPPAPDRTPDRAPAERKRPEAPDRAPGEMKRPDAPDRERPPTRGPAAEREAAPGAAARAPGNRPPTAGKPAPGKPGKPEKDDDDKKKKNEPPQ